MFFSLSDYKDPLDHTYFFVCFWISLFFQSRLFFKWWYTHAGLMSWLQHTLLCILWSMTIILIFQNEPHLPSPIFRTNGFCSQVVEGGELNHLAAGLLSFLMECRWGDPPERCCLSHRKVPGTPGGGKTLSLSSVGRGAAQCAWRNVLSNALQSL